MYVYVMYICLIQNVYIQKVYKLFVAHILRDSLKRIAFCYNIPGDGSGDG